MAQTTEQRRLAAKRARLMLLYRITPEEQDEVENFQRAHPRLRLLLEKGDPKEIARLYTDHDHSSGLFRGRLAYLINKGLGVIEGTYKERTPEILRALAEYLDYPPAVEALGEPHYGLLGRAKRKKKMVYGSSIKCPKCKHNAHKADDCSDRICDAAGDIDWCPCGITTNTIAPKKVRKSERK